MYGANTLKLYVVRGGTTEYQPFEQVIDFRLLKSKLLHSNKQLDEYEPPSQVTVFAILAAA